MFDGDMSTSLAIKGNRPQFSLRLFGMMAGAEDGVANPESQRPRGMIGAQEEALVVAGLLTRVVAAVICVEARVGERAVHRLHNLLPRCQLRHQLEPHYVARQMRPSYHAVEDAAGR